MNPRFGLFGVLGLAFVAVATAPLSLLLDRLPLAAQHIAALESSGTVWHGVLRSASWRGQALGDLTIRLQALPLLLDERRLRVGTASWSGTLLEGRRHGLVDGVGTVTLPAIATLAGGTLRLSMQDATLVFEDRRCLTASGRLQATLQMPDPALPEMRLTGDLTCAQEQGRVVLVSAAEAPLPLEAVLSIDAGGGYTLQSTARVQDPVARVALLLAGFRETSSGLVRDDSGRLVD